MDGFVIFVKRQNPEKMTTVFIDETSKEGQEMLQFLHNKEYATVMGDDWWFDLSDDERKSIHAGLQDLANGRTVPHEQVRKLYEQHLLSCR